MNDRRRMNERTLSTLCTRTRTSTQPRYERNASVQKVSKRESDRQYLGAQESLSFVVVVVMVVTFVCLYSDTYSILPGDTLQWVWKNHTGFVCIDSSAAMGWVLCFILRLVCSIFSPMDSRFAGLIGSEGGRMDNSFRTRAVSKCMTGLGR